MRGYQQHRLGVMGGEDDRLFPEELADASSVHVIGHVAVQSGERIVEQVDGFVLQPYIRRSIGNAATQKFNRV